MRAKVLTVRSETPASATIDLQVGVGWQGHQPGQYVRVGVDVNGVRQWRCYSISAANPCGENTVSITVKAIPGGVVSNYMVHQLTPGTIIHVDAAAGDFVVPATTPQKLLFITAGSGITPVMGILRSGAHRGAAVTVVHSARTPQDVIFGAELRAMHAAGVITLVERHSAVTGRLTMAELEHIVPQWREHHTMACGPVELLDACEQHWAEQGLLDQLCVERFRIAPVVVGDGGAVTFSKTGKTIETNGQKPLLEVGEEAGVPMPSGCRMGVCFTCVCTLKSGAVQDLRTGDITTAQGKDDVTIQTCISAAAGPCDIEP